jgi:poly(hydroxyalkanoate) granule-associated protein
MCVVLVADIAILEVKMAKQEVVQENGHENVILTNTRKIFHAGLGAVAMAQEEIGDLAKRLMERGETVEKENRQRLDDMFEKRRNQLEKNAERVENAFDKRLQSTLERVHIPTQQDIKALDTKLTRLNKKLDELRKEMA